MNTLQKIHCENMKSDIPEFNIGDSLEVKIQIVEGGKERTQTFTGTAIARTGSGISQSVTLRRFSYGEGIERVLPLHSPTLSGIKVVREGNTRRSKAYYLRERVGKAARK